MSNADEVMPTLVTHGTFRSWHHKRPATCTELLQCQGVSVYPALTGKPYPWPVLRLLQEKTISFTQTRKLAGNVFHTTAVGCLMMWALAHAVPVSCYVPTSITVDSDSDDEVVFIEGDTPSANSGTRFT